MTFKAKSAVLLAAVAFLPSCSYKIMESASKDSNVKHKIVAKSCSYAPLWLAPSNSNYLNIKDIKAKHHIKDVHNVKHVVYPFVLYTKTCLVVEGSK